MREDGHVAQETTDRYKWERPEVKRSIERPRRTTDDNSKVDLQEVGWGGMDLTDLAESRDTWRTLVNAAMKLRVP